MLSAWMPELQDFEAIDPATEGSFEVTFADGSKHTAVPVWQKFAEALRRVRAGQIRRVHHRRAGREGDRGGPWSTAPA